MKDFARKSSLRYHARIHADDESHGNESVIRSSIAEVELDDYSSTGSMDSHTAVVDVGSPADSLSHVQVCMLTCLFCVILPMCFGSGSRDLLFARQQLLFALMHFVQRYSLVLHQELLFHAWPALDLKL